MHQLLISTYKKTQGLAISTILLAIVLLAAIAVTIAMSSRSSNGNSSDECRYPDEPGCQHAHRL